MNIFLASGIFFISIVVGGVVIAYFIFLIDVFLRGHDLPTSTRATRALIKTISEEQPDAKTIVDLGCAYGSLALRLKKALPHCEVYGIDNNGIRIFFASLYSFFLRRAVFFRRQDIFKVDVRDADIVYTYLWYDRMLPLERKLQSELKKGAIVITNTSHFSNWQPIKKVVTYTGYSKLPDFETLFVYRKE